MNISWLGQSCFRIEDKIQNQPVVIVTDPFHDEATGLKLPKMEADLVCVSHNHDDHNNILAVGAIDGKNPVIIDRPGEYEIKNVFIKGIGSYHDKKNGEELGKSVMFHMYVNGINLLHLGDLGTTLSDSQLEKIGEVDILFVPVGGKWTIDAIEAGAVVRQIEPRIVIPMHYAIPGLKIELDLVEKFKKEMGGKFETMPKLKISAKDLPVDEIKLIVLDRD
ncbi:MAG: MBL fold metallo-hydrolase [Patescibacteria group bacterium]